MLGIFFKLQQVLRQVLRLTLMANKFFFVLAHSDLAPARHSGREGVDKLTKSKWRKIASISMCF